MPFIQKNGELTVTVPVGQKIIISSYGDGSASIYYGTVPSNQPNRFYLNSRLNNSSATYGTFTSARLVKIEAASSTVEYVIGVNPVLGNDVTRFKNGGALNCKPLASAPVTDVAEGDIYYDLTLHKLRVRTASAWETITSV